MLLAIIQSRILTIEEQDSSLMGLIPSELLVRQDLMWVFEKHLSHD
jgi:hypothetical protein